MKRRYLIKLAALSLASLLLPAFSARSPRAHALFKDMFGDDRLADRLGGLHLRQAPSAGGRGRSLAAKLVGMDASLRQEWLLARCQRDFSKLDIVTVDGWVMARSEADLCAAVHLDRRPE